MAKKQMGRPRIFEKDGPDVHGRISNAVAPNLEVQRKKLGALFHKVHGEPWKGPISDGDVIEFMLRGDVSTKLLWKGMA